MAISPNMEDLGFSIITDTGKSASEIKKLANSLSLLENILNSIEQRGFKNFKSGLRNVTSSLSTFYQGIGKIDTSGLKSFTSLANSMKKLGSVDLSSLSNSLSKLPVALKTLGETDTATAEAKIKSLAENLSGINFSNKGINGISSSLKKLPKALEELGKGDIDPAIAKLEKLADVTNKFDKETLQAVVKLKNFTKESRKAGKEVDKLGKEISKTDKKMKSAFGKINIAGSLHLIKRLATGVINIVQLSIDMTENINLFGVAMGETTDRAVDFVNSMSKVFGLDTSALMKYMGVFMELNTAMGMTKEQAYTISENFTKLGLDLASLWNITEEAAFEKLQQGLAGLPKGLRQIGIDISENALSMTAAEEAQKAYAAGNKALGDALSESIEKWDRVSKQQIIYLTILRQTKDAQGDFARTLESSVANKLKVLNNQFDKLKREFGNIGYVILDKVLPPLIAMTRVATDLIAKIAKLAGYELPSASEAAKTAAANITDTAGATDDLNESLAELNKTASLSIDELNTLGSTGSSGGLNLGFEGLELPDYDNLMGDFEYSMDSLYEKYSGYMDNLLTKMAGPIQTLKDIWNDQGKTMFDKILNETLPKLMEVAPAILDALIPLLDLVGPLLDLAVPLLDLVPPLVEVVALLAEVLTPLVEALVPVIIPVLDALAVGLEWLASAVENADMGSWDESFNEGIEAINEFFDYFFSAEAWQEVGETLAYPFVVAWEWVVQAFEDIGAWFENLFNSIGEWFEESIANIKGFFKSFFSKENWEEIGNILLEGITSAWQEIANWFAGIFESISEWFENTFGGLFGLNKKDSNEGNWFTDLFDFGKNSKQTAPSISEDPIVSTGLANSITSTPFSAVGNNLTPDELAAALGAAVANATQNQQVNLTVELDGNVIYNNQKQVSDRKGMSLLKGGSFSR